MNGDPSREVALEKILDRGSLEPGSGTVVILDDHPVAVFNIDGEYVAIDNTCPHRGGSLGRGVLTGDIVTCPWHGWEIDCRTGEAVENPGIRVTRYEVRLKGEGVYLDW